MLFGNKIRFLRDKQGILQRQVAAYLEIDTPMFSKIERGERRAKRSQVIQMATYFKVDEKEMLTLWLADKILSDLEGEEDLKLNPSLILNIFFHQFLWPLQLLTS